MNTGTLHYDYYAERYIVAFDDSQKRPIYLHCGDLLDAKIQGRWIPTAMEKEWGPTGDWYLLDVDNVAAVAVGDDLDGLSVRY